MQVILMERVAKLGQMGDVVNVKQGFARNFLIPTGKAMRASAANIAAFDAQKHSSKRATWKPKRRRKPWLPSLTVSNLL